MNSGIFSHFARAVRYFRKAHGLSQVELSSAVQLSTRHVQKIEAGRTNVRLSTVESFASHFTAPPCYLLRDEKKSILEGHGFGCLVEFLDLIPVGLQYHDLTGRILYSNRTHREMLGLTEEDTKKGIFTWEFMETPEATEASKRFFENVLKDQPPPAPYYAKMRSKNGDLIPMKIDWSYWRARNGTLLGFISVITQHPAW